MRVFAVRSKRSGYYFKFEELCGDGYGRYYGISNDLSDASLFSEPRDLIYDLANHSSDEAEWVGFEVTEVSKQSYEEVVGK